MAALTESKEIPTNDVSSSPRVKMRMLEQMAEALEDETAGLYRRAAAYEEEEFLLNREIGERQAEINRLLLKLEAMRAERDRIIEKIELISREAAAMREEVCNSEEELAVAAIDIPAAGGVQRRAPVTEQPVLTGDDPSRSAVFFRRMTLAEDIGRA